MATAKLIDNQTGKVYELYTGLLRIGRNNDNDIVVKSRMVSKYHIEIRRNITGYHIIDPGSKHGCYVNNDRLKKRMKLHDGDRIRLLIIYSDEEGEMGKGKEDESGTKTVTTRSEAVAKTHLDGNEKNINVVCDYTFRQEGMTLTERFFQVLFRR